MWHQRRHCAIGAGILALMDNSTPPTRRRRVLRTPHQRGAGGRRYRDEGLVMSRERCAVVPTGLAIARASQRAPNPPVGGPCRSNSPRTPSACRRQKGGPTQG
eukprot:9158661-Pyramimonas_sp.AAC.1